MDVKDINLNEYEVGECLANGSIVLRKKKSKFPTWESLGNISGVFIGTASEFLKLQVYLYLIAIEIYSLMRNTQNRPWLWLRFHSSCRITEE